MDASSSLRKHGHASERRKKVAHRKSAHVQEYEHRVEDVGDVGSHEIHREEDVGDVGDEIEREDDDVHEGGDDAREDILREEQHTTITPTPKPKRRSRKVKGSDVRVINNIPKVGPFPGGPQTNAVLSSFYDHVALKVWYKEERGALRVVHHTKKLKEWKIKLTWTRFRDLVNDNGLRVLGSALQSVNKALISAFVERWHSETSSFHMPFGEMTITLDDVKQITNLPIDGELAIGSYEMSHEDAVNLVHRCLGIEESDIESEFLKNNSQTLRLDWIKKNMSGKEMRIDNEDSGNDDTADEEEEDNNIRRSNERIDCAVRGYLLYCLGCNLLCDKTGNRVSIAYLKFLENIHAIDNYAWGAIGLAYLYRELGAASRCDVMQIAGFLALLEAWIYEHFPIFRGSLNTTYMENEPLMHRWNACTGVSDADIALITYRQQIDQLSSNNVIWDPYSSQRQTTRVIPDIAFYEGYLSCMDIRAPYLPNRVLRQFGLRQMIPLSLVHQHGDYYSQWSNHVFARESRVPIASGVGECVDNYMDWYIHHSHPLVQNVENWIGPTAKRAPAPCTSTSINDYERYVTHTSNAESILEALIIKGKKWCGKALSDIKKAHEQLIICRGGVPQHCSEPEDEGEEEAQVTVQGKRKRNARKR